MCRMIVSDHLYILILILNHRDIESGDETRPRAMYMQ